MPIYEYECVDCKKRFEVLQRLSDPPLVTCSACSGKVHKIVSSPSGLLFKGSGWYVTDYARKNSHTSDSKGDGKSTPSTPTEASKKETPAKSDPPSKE